MNDHANRRRERLNLQIISVKTVKSEFICVAENIKLLGEGQRGSSCSVGYGKVALVTTSLF